MGKHPQFDQIREEIEAKQKSILFPDGLRAGRSVDEFLWKGDPNAKPIQRAGLVVFGLMFSLPSILMFTAMAENYERYASFPGFAIGLGGLLIAIRLFRNAFLRSPKHQVKLDD